MGILDVTKEQLRQLDGESLRELVALLCEAEVQQAGLPVSAVKCGGAHTAADGGLDVEVDLENRQFDGDFVPRTLTGFQVKKNSMPPSRVPTEMSPKGQLRPIFHDLAERNGCYVIVSLADDPTGWRLTQRIDAMREQVSPVENNGNLHLAFYGCGKLSQWLRRHPGVQLWLHDRLGIPLRGWKSFGRWTYVPPDDDDRLISREGISIVLPERDAPKLEIDPGIDRIRDLVRTYGKPLRIVGLSGVGKTRIVQALFELDVGTDPLEHHLAVYADLGETPTPSPRDMCAWLHAQRHRAIMILDNCPRETHHNLAETVAQTSGIDLISIDLDVRDDRPETSSVIQVLAEGPGIAEVLVKRRHPGIGESNARRVAQLSEGNARMALALAAAARKGESLSAFSDLHLFNRLFYQGDSPEMALLKAATVLSLVYSFSVSDDRDTVDELEVLASLANQSRLALYGRVQELLDRQLAQKRGHFRAVLPQALADHLARRALDSIPSGHILESLQEMSDPRLLTSFGKRLGYLHDHGAAREIVTSWLGPGGILHEIENLSGTGLRLLTNAAPAAPGAALNALEIRFDKAHREQSLRGSMLESHGIAELLCAIAYEPEFFERCLRLLAIAARLETDDTSSADRPSCPPCSASFPCSSPAPMPVRKYVCRSFAASSLVPTTANKNSAWACWRPRSSAIAGLHLSRPTSDPTQGTTGIIPRRPMIAGNGSARSSKSLATLPPPGLGACPTESASSWRISCEAFGSCRTIREDLLKTAKTLNGTTALDRGLEGGSRNQALRLFGGRHRTRAIRFRFADGTGRSLKAARSVQSNEDPCVFQRSRPDYNG